MIVHELAMEKRELVLVVRRGEVGDDELRSIARES